jgi:hypothetical protein
MLRCGIGFTEMLAAFQTMLNSIFFMKIGCWASRIAPGAW